MKFGPLIRLVFGLEVRVVGFGSSDPEIEPLSAVELTPGGIDSACHPSEVGEMSTNGTVTTQQNDSCHAQKEEGPLMLHGPRKGACFMFYFLLAMDSNSVFPENVRMGLYVGGRFGQLRSRQHYS